MTDKRQLSCLRCGAGMRFIGRDKFQRRPDLFLSDLTFALAGGMEVDISSCSNRKRRRTGSRRSNVPSAGRSSTLITDAAHGAGTSFDNI